MRKSWTIRLLIMCLMFIHLQPVSLVSAAINCLSLSGSVALSTEVVNQGDLINLNYSLSSEGSLTTVPTRNPADVILTLDYSGSMSYPIDSDSKTNDSRLKAMQHASDTFLDELEDIDQQDRVGLTSFSSVAPKYDNISLTSSFSTIRNKINQWRADGGTNIEQSLTVAQEMLTASQPETPKYIILLTDGYATHYTYTDSRHRVITKSNDSEARRLALVNADQIGTTDVTIHTIALAQHGASKGNVDRALLQDIAAKTGGKMYDAENIEGLKQVFRNIVSDINEDDSFSRIKLTQILPEGIEVDESFISPFTFNEATRELTVNVEDVRYQGTQTIAIPIRVNSAVGQVQFNPATINYKNLCGEASTLQVAFSSMLDVQRVVWDSYLNTYVSTKQGEVHRYQSTGSQAVRGPLDWTFHTSGNIIEDIQFNEDGMTVNLYTVLNNVNNPKYSLDLTPTAPSVNTPAPNFDKWLTAPVTVHATGSSITAFSDYPEKFVNVSSAFTSNMIVGYEYRVGDTDWNSIGELSLATIEDGTLEVAAVTHAISKPDDTHLIRGHITEKLISIDNTPPELPQLSIMEYNEAAHRYTVDITNLVDHHSGLTNREGRDFSIQCVSCDMDTLVNYKTNNQIEISERDYLGGQFSVHVMDQVGNTNSIPLGIDVRILDNPTDNPWIQLKATISTIKRLSVRLDTADSYVQVTDGDPFFMNDVHARYASANERAGLQSLDMLADYELEDGTRFSYTHTIIFNVAPKLVATNISNNPTEDNPSIAITKLINTINKISVQVDGIGDFVEISSGQSYVLQDIHSSFNDRSNRLGRHQLITQVEHTLRDGSTSIHEVKSYFDVVPELFSVHISDIPNSNPEITVTKLANFIQHLKVRLDERGSFIAVTTGDPNVMEEINSYYKSVEKRVGEHKLAVTAEYDLGSGPVVETDIIIFKVVPNLVDIAISSNPTDHPNLTFTALSTAVQDIQVKLDELGSYEHVINGKPTKMDEIQAIFSARDQRLGWHKLDVKVTYIRNDGASADHTLTTYYKVNPGIDAELRTTSATDPATKPVLIHIDYDLPVAAAWGKLAVTVKERKYAITSSSTRPIDTSNEWKILRSDQFTVTETTKKDVYIHLWIKDTDGIVHQDPTAPLLISFNYKYDRY